MNSDKWATRLCIVCQRNKVRPHRKRCNACKIAAGKPAIDPNVYMIEGQPCRKIPLTRGLYALVDAGDYEWLMLVSWSAHYCDSTRSYYAYGSKVIMHVAIFGSLGPDHRNGDTLDNRRGNLRAATSRQNSYNRRLNSNNKTGFKGVSFYQRDKRKYRAQGRDEQGKIVALGSYADPVAAARIYDAWARAHYGEFAKLNFPAEECAVVD